MNRHKPAALLVFGAGGHARVVADVSSRMLGGVPLGFLDDQLDSATVAGWPVLGRLSDWQEAVEKLRHEYGEPVGMAIGLGDNALRRRVALEVEKSFGGADGSAQIITVTDPSSVLASRTNIGVGSVVLPQSVVNADATVGRHVILNTGCSVDHDCRIGDYAHVSPGVRLAGGVHVGEGAHIGIGASVIPGVRIGAWSVVGAGSVVVRDIPDRVVAFGVPAQVRRSLD